VTLSGKNKNNLLFTSLGMRVEKLSNLGALTASLSTNAVSPQLDFVSSSQLMCLYQARRYGTPLEFAAFFYHQHRDRQYQQCQPESIE
jgi:hypothetical protein